MRRVIMSVAALALAFGATGAQASWWGFRGGHTNDTGGIFPWSPDIAYSYREIAAAECARWNKVAIVTSVHPVYGDYVAFVCRFPRYYDPRRERLAGPYVIVPTTRIRIVK